MSVEKQWTQWHLLTSGWVRGSSQIDGVATRIDQRFDRFMTCEWREERGEVGQVDARYLILVGEYGDPAIRERLLATYGDCPEQL